MKILSRWIARNLGGATETVGIEVEGLPVELTRKSVRTLRLSVHPPEGELRLTVPWGVSEAAARAFVAERMDWVERQRERVRARALQAALVLETGATVWWFGRPLRLAVMEGKGKAGVAELPGGVLELRCRPGSGAESRLVVLRAGQRDALKALVPGLAAVWEPVLGVRAAAWGVKRMRTRWGSCNPAARRIWLSLELAAKPVECIEYVVVHELAHLLEPGHGPRFKAILDRTLPDWRRRRALLEAPAPGV